MDLESGQHSPSAACSRLQSFNPSAVLASSAWAHIQPSTSHVSPPDGNAHQESHASPHKRQKLCSTRAVQDLQGNQQVGDSSNSASESDAREPECVDQLASSAASIHCQLHSLDSGQSSGRQDAQPAEHSHQEPQACAVPQPAPRPASFSAACPSAHEQQQPHRKAVPPRQPRQPSWGPGEGRVVLHGESPVVVVTPVFGGKLQFLLLLAG